MSSICFLDGPNGPTWSEMDKNGSKWIELDQLNHSGPKWTRMERSRPKWTEMDLSGLNRPKYYTNIAQKYSNKMLCFNF